MKTDDIFYQIFQTSPALAFELMGEIPPCQYEFRAQEVKSFGFRTDGLMFPQSDNPNHPIIFLEAQMQRDRNLYYRILNELTTYLRQYQPPNPWRVIVLYPQRSVEQEVPQLEQILSFCNLSRFYLNELTDGGSLSQDILRLIVTSQTEAESKARQLLQRTQKELLEPSQRTNFLELLVEITARIFPELSQEEIRRMLELVPFTQTRFYQEVKREGRQEGRQEGREEGMRSLLMRQLFRRLGEIPQSAQTQIEQLTLEQTESLAEALLDFTSLEDLLSWLQQSPQN
ncbi:MAG: Rpn family recombination-promoting nuclease/putative transposase [Halothece sp. Uz-M2-17]|nr:Rpn family recombination-promoting nuclease/putative transposase [Halothece sp. Uz-M2-17]